MSGLEINKIVASILLGCLIVMMVGFVANILYNPDLSVKTRGYSIAVDSASDLSAGAMSEREVTFDIAELMKKANAEAGKAIAKKCISCHSFEKGGPNKIGPHLWGIVGAQKARATDYKYSTALSSKGGVWDEDSLFHLLYKPSKYLPGTKMSFAGLKNPEDIANVVAYLKTLSD